MPSPGETRLMCREVRRWRVVGGGTLRGGRWIGGVWIKEARRGFGPPNAGEVAIYGSQAGKDDAGCQLTQLIDGHPYMRQFYGTRERIEVRYHLSAALLWYCTRSKVDEDEINESILRLFHLWWPIECERSHTDATRGPRNTD